MPVLCQNPDELYVEIPFELESDFETKIIKFSDAIFGKTSIYIDVKKRMGKSVITIPDGYLIDMADPDNPVLFVIENEIVSHDPFRHIGMQMLKFVTSFAETRKQIRDMLMTEIEKSSESLRRLKEGLSQSDKRNIDNYLDAAVYGKFKGIVVIDHAREELYNVLNHINAEISVLTFRQYGAGSKQFLYEFETLYDEGDSEPVSNQPELSDKEAREKRKARRAKSDTIIVPAHAEGFENTFIGENCWYSIRIGAAMKDRIKYIAAYQIRPISAVTHIAEVSNIVPFEDTGKYKLLFKGPAQELDKPIKIGDPKKAPQAPLYAVHDDLISADILENAWS